ncbi:L,D-transpeptidase family protein [Streptomyces niveiscabiei]|uniref:L,D-transpeptidase family protein n=1 Tax=Streptomyces niveiscabiei TaxID=164115 RepID=A0ABW9I736_9ACTN
MERMRGTVTRSLAAAGALLVALTGCAGTQAHDGADAGAKKPAAARALTAVPDLGPDFRKRIPAASRQVVAVYGDGRNSPDATAVLYIKQGRTWQKESSWPAHNARKGWTTDHHENDGRSPVGVFTLTDAGGVLKNPGTKLPYTRSSAFETPSWWQKPYRHDFDYVIAIDYNRIKGTSPSDPTRPEGEKKGGSIWLHMDQGSGTSACVSLSKAGMEHLLRTLDPAAHPVVVMGDRAELKA